MLLSNVPLVHRDAELTERFLRAFFDAPWELISAGRARKFPLSGMSKLMDWAKQNQEHQRNVFVPLPSTGGHVWHLAVRAPATVRPADISLPPSLVIIANGYWLLWRSNDPLPPRTARLLSERLAKEIGGGAREALGDPVPLPGTVFFHPIGVNLGGRSQTHMMIPRPTAYRLIGDVLTDTRATAAPSPFTRADTVKAKPVEWIWPGFLATGTMALLGGAAGMGKSTVSADFAGIVSSGGKWPTGERCEVGSALVLEAEDDLERTVVPRLLAAGADLKRVGLGKVVDLTESLALLEDEAKRRPDLRLVILSPIRKFMGKAEDHGNLGIRSVLDPLLAWAERRRVAILGIAHPEKGKEHREAFAGSAAFLEVARAAYSVIPDPADKNPIVKQKRRLFVAAKNNLGADSVTLRYRLDGATVNGISTSRVVWG
jgi:AAA domain